MRLGIANLVAGLGALGAVQGCYYSALGMENMYDFWYRWCADGCRDIPVSDSNYAACCSPLTSGASTSSVCTSLSTECAAAGTTCAWSSAVPTSDFPSSAYTYATSYTGWVAPSSSPTLPGVTSQASPGTWGGETTTVTVTSTTTTPCASSAAAMPTSMPAPAPVSSSASCDCDSGMAAGSTALYSIAECTTSGCPNQGAGKPSGWTGDYRKRSGHEECVCPPASSTHTEVIYSSTTTTTTSTIQPTSSPCSSTIIPEVYSSTTATSIWSSSAAQDISSGMAAMPTSLPLSTTSTAWVAPSTTLSTASSAWTTTSSTWVTTSTTSVWVASSTSSDDGVLYRSYTACTSESCPFQGAGKPSDWAGDYTSASSGQGQKKRAGRPSDWAGDYTSQQPTEKRALPSDYIPLEYNHRNASHKRDYHDLAREITPASLPRLFPAPTPFKLIKRDYVTTTITAWVTTDDCYGQAAMPTSVTTSSASMGDDDDDDCDDDMTSSGVPPLVITSVASSGMAAGSTVLPSSTVLYEPWASGNGMEGAGKPSDWSGSDYASSVAVRRGWMAERQRGL